MKKSFNLSKNHSIINLSKLFFLACVFFSRKFYKKNILYCHYKNYHRYSLSISIESSNPRNKNLPRFLAGRGKGGKKRMFLRGRYVMSLQKRSSSHKKHCQVISDRLRTRVHEPIEGWPKPRIRRLGIDVEGKNWDFAGESTGLPAYWFSVGSEEERNRER